MKKFIVVILVLSCSISLLTACSSNNSTLEFSFEPKVLYTGFQNLPQDYSLKDAEKDGCVAIQELKIVANQKTWDKFVKVAKRGINTSIRLVYSNTYVGGSSVSVIDLFYNDGAYYLFDSSAESLEKRPFEYLIALEGQYGDLLQKNRLFILADNNKEITFDDTFAIIANGSSSSFGICLILFLKD